MILWVNCTLATVACVANLWSAVHRRSLTRNAMWMRSIRGVLAGVYAATMFAEAVGVMTTLERIGWAQGLGLLAWPLVWCLPAFIRMEPHPDPDRLAEEIHRRVQGTIT